MNTLATEHRFSMRSLNASLGTSEGSGCRIRLHRWGQQGFLSGSQEASNDEEVCSFLTTIYPYTGWVALGLFIINPETEITYKYTHTKNQTILTI